MPITLQKKRSSKDEFKTIEEDHKNNTSNSFLRKLCTPVPAALILLLVIFVYSSCTTFISGSIVHICVTSRKLNSHLYCLSAGDQISDADPTIAIQKNYTLLTTNEETPDVFTSPLSSLSTSIKEDISLINNVKPPSTITMSNLHDSSVPEQPSDGDDNSKNVTTTPKSITIREKMETQGSIIRLPVDGSGNGDDNSKNVTATPTSIANRVKKENKTKREDDNSKNVTTTPKSITIREKMETQGSIIRLPVDGSGNGDDNSKNVTATPTSIANREKKENKTKREEEIEIARKDVEEQMEILRSYKKAKTANYSDPDCDGRGIYVYDLPHKFNKELLSYCSDMMSWMDFCTFLTNNAFGEAVPQLGDGWYNTHQYSLEPIFHARVLKHPCRVNDPEEAKLFYVPYYGGFDVLRWHFKENTTVEVKDKLSYELIEWLNQQKPWKRNFGLDHLFVLGKITWDFRRVDSVGWGTKFLDLNETQNSIKLLIERQPWQINDIGVPHPSFFHPRSDQEIIAWQKKLMQTKRKHLVSFVGAPRPKDQESIRSILIEQCTSASDKCGFFDCSEGGCTKTEAVMESLMESEFCLQPPGDSPTRKSVFDSLVAGCIPVLFDPFTAYYQYPWHLPSNRSDYSVYVDQEAVRRHEINVVEQLAAVPEDRRAEMRRRIVYEVLPALVYADPEGKLERFEDAFTVAMNGVLERMSRLP